MESKSVEIEYSQNMNMIAFSSITSTWIVLISQRTIRKKISKTALSIYSAGLLFGEAILRLVPSSLTLKASHSPSIQSLAGFIPVLLCLAFLGALFFQKDIYQATKKSHKYSQINNGDHPYQGSRDSSSSLLILVIGSVSLLSIIRGLNLGNIINYSLTPSHINAICSTTVINKILEGIVIISFLPSNGIIFSRIKGVLLVYSICLPIGLCTYSSLPFLKNFQNLVQVFTTIISASVGGIYLSTSLIGVISPHFSGHGSKMFKFLFLIFGLISTTFIISLEFYFCSITHKKSPTKQIREN